MSLTCLLGHNWYQPQSGRERCYRCGIEKPHPIPTLREESVNEQPNPDLTVTTPTQPVEVNIPAVIELEPWELGQRVVGEFRVEHKLGNSETDSGYWLIDEHNNQRFAAKRINLSAESTHNQGLEKLQLWANLPPHPHILSLQCVRVTDHECVILTDPMVNGSLQHRLENAKPPSLESALDLAIQYAWGLHALHELGYTHQNVTPSNAMLDDAGILKVMNCEALLNTNPESPALEYCSPEQARQEKLTKHTDSWSWGLTVLAICYGKNNNSSGPLALQTLNQLEANQGGVNTTLLPRALFEVLQRCFQNRIEDRWPTMLDAAKALVELYPTLCKKPYFRVQPLFYITNDRLQARYNHRIDNIQWDNPRPWLEGAQRAEGCNPITLQPLPTAWTSSRKVQAAADLALYDNAYQILARLVQSGRGSLREALAALCIEKALVHRYLKDVDNQIKMSDQAITIRQQLVATDGRQDLQPELAYALESKATIIADMGQLPDTLVLYDQAITIYQQIIADNKHPELESNLVYTLTNKALTLSNMNQMVEAVAVYDSAFVICQRLVVEEQRYELEPTLATILMNKADAVSNVSNMPQAPAFYDRAISIRQHLVNTGRCDLKAELAAALIGKARTISNRNQLSEASTLYSQAIVIYQQLITGQPNLGFNLATAYINKASIAKSMDKLSESIALYDQAITLYQNRINLEPQDLRLDLAAAIANKALVIASRDASQLSEAVTLYNQSIAILQQMVQKGRRRDLESDLATTIMHKAVMLEQMRQLPLAIACYDWTIAILERLIQEQPKLEPDFAMALRYKAAALSSMGNLSEALAIYDRVIAIRKRLVVDYKQWDLIGGWVRAVFSQADILVKLGNAKQAQAKITLLINTLQQKKADLEQKITENNSSDIEALKIGRSELKKGMKQALLMSIIKPST